MTTSHKDQKTDNKAPAEQDENKGAGTHEAQVEGEAGVEQMVSDAVEAGQAGTLLEGVDLSKLEPHKPSQREGWYYIVGNGAGAHFFLTNQAESLVKDVSIVSPEGRSLNLGRTIVGTIEREEDGQLVGVGGLCPECVVGYLDHEAKKAEKKAAEGESQTAH